MTNVYDGVKTCDEAILDYAIGALSPARRAIIKCQREISAAIDHEVNFQEAVAASFMVNHDAAKLSAGFFDRVSEQIEALRSDVDLDHLSSEVSCADEGQGDVNGAYQTPQTLAELCGKPLSEIKWKTVAPGVAMHDILGGRDTERLYLLRAKRGISLPEHSHTGEEWTLLLTGGYEASGVNYTRGDLHISNDEVEHSPKLDGHEDCMCLVMTEGPLKLKGFLPRLLQPLIGL